MNETIKFDYCKECIKVFYKMEQDMLVFGQYEFNPDSICEDCKNRLIETVNKHIEKEKETE